MSTLIFLFFMNPFADDLCGLRHVVIDDPYGFFDPYYWCKPGTLLNGQSCYGVPMKDDPGPSGGNCGGPIDPGDPNGKNLNHIGDRTAQMIARFDWQEFESYQFFFQPAPNLADHAKIRFLSLYASLDKWGEELEVLRFTLQKKPYYASYQAQIVVEYLNPTDYPKFKPYWNRLYTISIPSGGCPIWIEWSDKTGYRVRVDTTTIELQGDPELKMCRLNQGFLEIKGNIDQPGGIHIWDLNLAAVDLAPPN
ncbi:MAG: hypothetical protein H6510_16565 [Acidobacteria bacterium]|nr:hypothetical protein [Acidobacteriota bacterium]MCB9399428.1 hypothetical protein [Acidobacteriota bacterium]